MAVVEFSAYALEQLRPKRFHNRDEPLHGGVAECKNATVIARRYIKKTAARRSAATN
jgi:hypothetical protein